MNIKLSLTTGKQLNQEEHEKAENERHLQALTAQINLAKIERQDRERHLIENIITGSQASLDKALLTISSSAIALSYYFVRDGFDPSTGWILITSWLGWCMTIAASIVSIVTSIQANAHHSQAVADADPIGDNPFPNSQNTISNKITIFLNWFGGGVFFISAVLMTTFGYLNLQKIMEDKEKEVKIHAVKPHSERERIPDYEDIAAGRANVSSPKNIDVSTILGNKNDSKEKDR
ncbi:MAG: hypothetical protein LUE13_02445 [Akkermansiaceae bacterium]|nr:hypothetical protein [Akkermansiaceae bacterium]